MPIFLIELRVNGVWVPDPAIRQWFGDNTSALSELARLLREFPADERKVTMYERFAERAEQNRPAKHEPKCKPDFPFYLCPVCYPGL